MAFDGKVVKAVAVDMENKIQITDYNKKIDVRQFYLPEDSIHFLAGKGLRFFKNQGPEVAQGILEAASAELAANPKVAKQIMELCQAALAPKGEVV